MTSKLIGQRTRALRARTRRKLIGTTAGPLAAGFLCAYSLHEFPALRDVLELPFVLAIAWSLIGLYLLNRGMWSVATLGDVGLNPGLQACRLEIERQRDLVRRFLVWSFGPSLLAIATFLVALTIVSTEKRGILPNGLPFLTLMVVWIVLWFLIRVREQRRLQREIDELNDIEMESHSQY